MSTKSDSSHAENTETKVTVHIIMRSSSGTILKIRSYIDGQKMEKTYTRLQPFSRFGAMDIALLDQFLLSLRRTLRDTNLKNDLDRIVKAIMADESQNLR